jgi:hypothetical protein
MASFSGTTYKQPSLGVVGTGVSTDSVYTRVLNLDIIDIEKSKSGQVNKVYECKATSIGTSETLPPVMPALIGSIFDDFPGISGVTREVTKPLAINK